eukprot:6473381-Amphidinium_carterae.2
MALRQQSPRLIPEIYISLQSKFWMTYPEFHIELQFPHTHTRKHPDMQVFCEAAGVAVDLVHVSL